MYQRMTKEHALNNMLLPRAQFAFSLVAFRWAMQRADERPDLGAFDTRVIITDPEHPELNFEVPPLPTVFAPFLLSGPEKRRVFEDEWQTTERKRLVQITHEIVAEYAADTHQTRTFEAAPFFDFARIMRNSVAHRRGGIFLGWPKALRDRGITELTWRHRRIDESMAGKLLTFSGVDAFMLWEDHFFFLRDVLA